MAGLFGVVTKEESIEACRGDILGLYFFYSKSRSPTSEFEFQRTSTE